LGPLLKPALHILATAVLGVLLAGGLIRMAPGFGIDEREFDVRLNDDSVRRIRAEAGAGGSGPFSAQPAATSAFGCGVVSINSLRHPRNPVIIDVRVWAE
jgi:hypothetical protein